MSREIIEQVSIATAERPIKGFALDTAIYVAQTKQDVLDEQAISNERVAKLVVWAKDIAKFMVFNDDGSTFEEKDLPSGSVDLSSYIQKHTNAELNKLFVAYQGKYGENRVHYPVEIQQDVNGWSVLDFTGNMLFFNKDKATGDRQNKVLELRNSRGVFHQQPYFLEEKLTSESDVEESISKLLDKLAVPSEGIDVDRVAEAPFAGYANQNPTVWYEDGYLKAPRFDAGESTCELLMYKDERYNHLLIPVSVVEAALGKTVTKDDLEIGIVLKGTTTTRLGKSGELPPTNSILGSKWSYNAKAIPAMIPTNPDGSSDGTENDANNPSYWLKSDGSLTENFAEARKCGYGNYTIMNLEEFGGMVWRNALRRGRVKQDKSFVFDLTSPYYVVPVRTGGSLNQTRQHTVFFTQGEMTIYPDSISAHVEQQKLNTRSATDTELFTTAVASQNTYGTQLSIDLRER